MWRQTRRLGISWRRASGIRKDSLPVPLPGIRRSRKGFRIAALSSFQNGTLRAISEAACAIHV